MKRNTFQHILTKIDSKHFYKSIDKGFTVLSADLTQSPLTSHDLYHKSTGLNFCYDNIFVFNDCIYDETIHSVCEITKIQESLARNLDTEYENINNYFEKYYSFETQDSNYITRGSLSPLPYQKEILKFASLSFEIAPTLSYVNSIINAIINALKTLNDNKEIPSSYFEYILQPLQESSLKKLNLKFLGIYNSVHNTGQINDLESEINEYRTSTFDWLNPVQISITDLLSLDITQMIHNYEKTAPYLKSIEKYNLEQFTDNEKTRKLIDLGRSANWFKTFRSVVINRIHAQLYKYIKNSFASLGIDHSIIPHLLLDEILELKIPTKNTIDARKDSFCLFLSKSEKILHSESECVSARIHLNKFDSSYLEGKCVSVPKSRFISGRAHIVNSKMDIYKFRKGDILVAKHTSPALGPAIMNSSAVLVEEGGLLSHTAIICRELHIPCLVGVSNLLTEIRSGDMLRIDFQNGAISSIDTL